MSGYNAIGELPISTLEDESNDVVSFASAAETDSGDTVYLVVIEGYRASEATGDWVMPIGTTPIAALPDGEETVTSTVTLRFSDRDWATDPADATLPNVWFEGRAIEPLAIDREIPLDPTASRRLALNVGTIELANQDGELDDIADTVSIDGRPVTVLFGKRSDAYADFGIVFKGVGVGSLQPSGNTVRLAVREVAYGLEASLLGVYAGTGGVDGDAEIEGQVKRRAYGPVKNVTPRSINKSALVYQLHDGAIQSVDAVRDGGLALTLDTSVGTSGDVTDYATLAAATIGTGKYVTCLALGLLRVKTAPTGALTVDFKGGKLGGAYVSHGSDVVKGLLQADGALEDADLDLGAFAYVKGTFPGEVEVCFDEQCTIADAITKVVAGMPLCWWGGNRQGLVTIGRTLSPSLAGYRFDTYNITGELQWNDLPASVAPAVWRVIPAYQPNWTVQRPADLLGATTAANVELYGKPCLTGEPVTEPTRVTRDPTACDVTLQTLMSTAADAEFVAAEVSDFFRSGRKLPGLPVKTVVHLMDLGDALTLYHPRYGLSGGRNMIVIGIQERCSTRSGILKVFG